MNALAKQNVADYLNESFVSTYLKVGTFQIVGGQKQGGNVASYFCLSDGSVLHAVPGKVDANRFLQEARWAYEVHKSALTYCTNLVTGQPSVSKYRDHVKKAHTERYFAEAGAWGRIGTEVPATFPLGRTTQAQACWLLAREPLKKIDRLYPVVWTQILNEQLSGLPVDRR